MTLFQILDVSAVDGLSVLLCVITIWWCVQYVPKTFRPTRIVLALLGLLTAALGTRLLDAAISVAFLTVAIMLEISPRSTGEKTT